MFVPRGSPLGKLHLLTNIFEKGAAARNTVRNMLCGWVRITLNFAEIAIPIGKRDRLQKERVDSSSRP